MLFFFCKKKVFIVFLEGHILLLIFYPINLIVAYPLNENKPQLLTTIKNGGWKFDKQSLNFLAISKPESLATQLLIKKLICNLAFRPLCVIYKTKIILHHSWIFADFCKKMLISANFGEKQVISINFLKHHMIVKLYAKFEDCTTFSSNTKTEEKDFLFPTNLTEKRLTQHKKTN